MENLTVHETATLSVESVMRKEFWRAIHWVQWLVSLMVKWVKMMDAMTG